MNVVCFPQAGSENAARARNARIVGFASSRENQIGLFTHGLEDSRQLQNYHPDYLVRYREEFDYYSAGIVLLEIGFWDTLVSLTNTERFRDISREQFKTELLASRVPQLGLTMGSQYMEATRVCLQGGFA